MSDETTPLLKFKQTYFPYRANGLALWKCGACGLDTLSYFGEAHKRVDDLWCEPPQELTATDIEDLASPQLEKIDLPTGEPITQDVLANSPPPDPAVTDNAAAANATPQAQAIQASFDRSALLADVTKTDPLPG